jgi:hypothetical protein
MTPARTTSGFSAGESDRDRLIVLGTLLQVRAKNRVESLSGLHFGAFPVFFGRPGSRSVDSGYLSDAGFRGGIGFS